MADRSLGHLWAAPNLITYGRILAIPVVMVFMQMEGQKFALYAALLFGFAALTDALDGYLARRMNAVSMIGELLDPLADKLLVTGALIMLVELRRVSAWLVFVILSREILITGLRAVAAGSGMIIPASKVAKQKTFFQMLGVSFLLVHYSYPFLGIRIDFHTLGFLILLLSLFLSLLSAGRYFESFFKEIEKRSFERKD